MKHSILSGALFFGLNPKTGTFCMRENYFAWWSNVVKMKCNIGDIGSAVRWGGTTDRTDFDIYMVNRIH